MSPFLSLLKTRLLTPPPPRYLPSPHITKENLADGNDHLRSNFPFNKHDCSGVCVRACGVRVSVCVSVCVCVSVSVPMCQCICVCMYEPPSPSFTYPDTIPQNISLSKAFLRPSHSQPANAPEATFLTQRHIPEKEEHAAVSNRLTDE